MKVGAVKADQDPFGGLFGSVSQQKVLQELVADPYSTYTPTDLIELTELTEPTVREAVSSLLELGILRNISRRPKRPLYQVNQESRRIVALMFLSYATLDDRFGEDHMADAVKDYYESIQFSRFEIDTVSITNVRDDSYWDMAKAALSVGKDHLVAAVGV